MQWLLVSRDRQIRSCILNQTYKNGYPTTLTDAHRHSVNPSFLRVKLVSHRSHYSFPTFLEKLLKIFKSRSTSESTLGKVIERYSFCNRCFSMLRLPMC